MLMSFEPLRALCRGHVHVIYQSHPGTEDRRHELVITRRGLAGVRFLLSLDKENVVFNSLPKFWIDDTFVMFTQT